MGSIEDLKLGVYLLPPRLLLSSVLFSCYFVVVSTLLCFSVFVWLKSREAQGQTLQSNESNEWLKELNLSVICWTVVEAFIASFTRARIEAAVAKKKHKYK